MDESISITDHAARMLLGILKMLQAQEYLGDYGKIHFDPDMLKGLVEDIENKRM